MILIASACLLHHCYNMEHHCTRRPTKLPFIKLPFSQKSTFYQACKMALALPTFFKKDHIWYLVNQLSHLILCWLHHCGAYNPNVKFIHQQKCIIQFMCSSHCLLRTISNSSCHLPFVNPLILSSRNKTNASHSNYKYFQKKKQTLHAVTPFQFVEVPTLSYAPFFLQLDVLVEFPGSRLCWSLCRTIQLFLMTL
jgi:hypothetical protein